jgi:hypothetical protein
MTIENPVGGHFFFAALAALRRPFSATLEVSCTGNEVPEKEN